MEFNSGFKGLTTYSSTVHHEHRCHLMGTYLLQISAIFLVIHLMQPISNVIKDMT